MKPVNFTVVYHNKTAKVRMVGRLFTVTVSTLVGERAYVSTHKLLSEDVAACLLGRNVVEKAMTYGVEIDGITLNVQPVTLEMTGDAHV